MPLLKSPRAADLAERASWTAGQAFLAVLLTSRQADSGLPWTQALSIAVGAAIVSILVTLTQYLSGYNPHDFFSDLLVRLAKTFIAAFVAAVGASAFDVVSFDWGRALDAAFVATLAALGKCALAAQTDRSPSTLNIATYSAAAAPVRRSRASSRPS